MDDRAKDALTIISRISLSINASVNLRYVRDHVLDNRKKKLGKVAAFLLEQQLINAVVLDFCKWIEFYRQYRDVIPASILSHADQLNSDICKLSPRDFRNNFIGHILNRKTGKPLSPQEIVEHYKSIVGNSFDEFWLWVGDMSTTINPNTIVGRMEIIRTEIKETCPNKKI